jgi:hypothetical protein
MMSFNIDPMVLYVVKMLIALAFVLFLLGAISWGCLCGYIGEKVEDFVRWVRGGIK